MIAKQQQYIGLTIGPIYSTLQNARSTRELWAGSYLFSHLMRKIIQCLKDAGYKNDDFIVPSTDKVNSKEVYKQLFGAGVFPDRLILKERNNLFSKIENSLKNKVIPSLALDYCDNKLDIDDLEVQEFSTFLQEYLQIYYIKKEIPETDNIIFHLSPFLDILEEQTRYRQSIKQYDSSYANGKKSLVNLLEDKLTRINASRLRKLVLSGAETDSYRTSFGFPSVAHIASYELSKRTDTQALYWEAVNEAESDKEEDADYTFENLQKKLGNRVEPYHKYICIVHADGDNIGKTIGAIEANNAKGYQKFSVELSQFAEKAAVAINDYGGKPVYIGGDDLLFFAPVKSVNSKNNAQENIFDLLSRLDGVFEKCEFEPKKDDPKPTLSFGMSITYYKFPLFEALDISKNLLFEKAKALKGAKGEELKNALAFRVLKHSGQYFETTINVQSKTYKKFKDILHLRADADAFLSSMMYKIRDNEVLLTSMVKGLSDENRNKRLSYYFDNFFNETVHELGRGSGFKEDVKELLQLAFQEYGYLKPIDTLYALLRMIHFLIPNHQTHAEYATNE